MYDIPLKQVIDASLSKISNVADVNTVIGEPITTPDGITIVPFSKVSVGYASGGADYSGKATEQSSENPPHFAGGNGAGVSVVPMGFLVIEKGNVRILDLKHEESFANASDNTVNKAADAINTIIERSPEIISKIKDIFAKRKAAKEEKKEEIPDISAEIKE